MDARYIEELFSLVKCPRCNGKGIKTVSREESHDTELCHFCKGFKQVPTVVAEQFENNYQPNRRIIDAAAYTADKEDRDYTFLLVVNAYERSVLDPSKLKALMDEASN